MAWLTSVATVARSGVSRWRGERLGNARFRFRLVRAAFGRLDNLPAGFVLAAGLLDREVDWLQEPARGEAWL
jgi:hypothetical protein